MLFNLSKTLLQACTFTTVFTAATALHAQSSKHQENPYAFTTADINFLQKFSLSALPPVPDAPSNQYADSMAAATLGRAVFFDKRLSKGKKFSCATCHQPEKYFTDGLAKAKAAGETRRSTPSLVGGAWSHWQYWDGRKDSLWSQALSPIEDHNEIALNRSTYVRKVMRYYNQDYQRVFGPLERSKEVRKIPKNASPLGDDKAKKRWQKMPPEQQQLTNEIFSNMGKALMAYQRKIPVFPARFDYFIDDLVRNNGRAGSSLLNQQEVEGLRLFMGKANCASCHNGPLFTNFEFHNIGAPEADESHVDLGRYEGVQALVKDEFTCLSPWSDAKKEACKEMTYLKRSGPELVGAVKTPTLRNILHTAPYMQAGQFASLAEVVAHYSSPQPPFYDRDQHPYQPHFDILPLKLTPEESASLVAFLATLSSPYPKDNFWWNPKVKTVPNES